MKQPKRALWTQAHLASIHQSMALTGVAVSWLLAVYLVLGGLWMHDRVMIAAAVAPIVVALLLMRMTGRSRGRGELVFVLAGCFLVAGQKLIDSDLTRTPAIVLMIALGGTMAMVLRRSRRMRLLIPWAGAVAVAPAWWDGFGATGLTNGVTALLAFTLLLPLAITARNTVSAGERRYAELFAHLPMSVLEQDWTPVRRELDLLRSQGVGDLAGYLSANPEQVSRLISKVVVTDANPWAAAMLGTSDPEQLRGPLGRDRVTSENWQHFADQLVAYWNRETLFQSQFRTTTRSGDDLWVQLRWIDTATALPDGRGRVIVAASDMTDVKRAEVRNARLARLRGDLINAVGHELRTPLSVVVGLADELAASHQTFGHHDLDDLLGMLSREAGTVATIVDNLITASLIETGDLNIEHRVFDLLAAAHTASERTDVQIINETPGTLLVVGDERRTLQLLRNVMINCSHYGSRTMRLTGSSDAGTACLSLSAVTSQLAESGIDHILTNEGGIDRDGITTGFGLSIGVARDLAMLMGGRLAFAQGQGTSVFTLYLPGESSGDNAEPEPIAS